MGWKSEENGSKRQRRRNGAVDFKLPSLILLLPVLQLLPLVASLQLQHSTCLRSSLTAIYSASSRGCRASSSTSIKSGSLNIFPAAVTSSAPNLSLPRTLSQIEIRRATVRDFPAIASTRKTIIFVPKQGGGNGAGVVRRALENASSQEEREMLSKIPYLVTGQAIAFIAIGKPKISLGGSGSSRVIGTVDVFERDREGPSLPRRLFLKNMIVDPDFRRQGLARRLLARTEDHAREVGIKEIHLEVLANNEAAKALYEEQGFEYTRGPLDSLWRLLKIGKVTMTKRL